MTCDGVSCFLDGDEVTKLGRFDVNSAGFESLWGLWRPSAEAFPECEPEVLASGTWSAAELRYRRAIERYIPQVLASVSPLLVFVTILVAAPSAMSGTQASLLLVVALSLCTIVFTVVDAARQRYVRALSGIQRVISDGRKNEVERSNWRSERCDPHFWDIGIEKLVVRRPEEPEGNDDEDDDEEEKDDEEELDGVTSGSSAAPFTANATPTAAILAPRPTTRSLRLGERFEREVAALLEADGWAVKLTPSRNDYGVDIFACRLGAAYVVQCKYRRKGKTGVGALRDLAGAAACFKAERAILVTREPPKMGRQWAYYRQQLRLEVWDRSDLAALAKQLADRAAQQQIARMSETPTANRRLPRTDTDQS